MLEKREMMNESYVAECAVKRVNKEFRAGFIKPIILSSVGITVIVLFYVC